MFVPGLASLFSTQGAAARGAELGAALGSPHGAALRRRPVLGGHLPRPLAPAAEARAYVRSNSKLESSV